MSSEETHQHLAWFGYTTCSDQDCTRPRADPADDMRCTDPDCEGGCEAALHNAARRQHLDLADIYDDPRLSSYNAARRRPLDAAVIRGIERVTGERYENGQWLPG
jgi:hypothetical protein